MSLNKRLFIPQTLQGTAFADFAELEFHFDAADTNSYSGSGTSWYDLVDSNVYFSNAGGRANWLSEGSWNFDAGANEYMALNPYDSFHNDYGTGTFCVAAWLWTDTVASGISSFLEQRGFSDGSNNGWAIYRDGSSLKMYGKANESTSRELINVSSAFTVSTWTHIVVQRTGTTWEAYVNGNLATNSGSYKDNSTYQTDDLGNSDPTDSQLIMSREWQTNSKQWDGKISDVKILSTSVTQGDVNTEFAIKQFASG